MKTARIIVMVLQLIVGSGAVAGGFAAITNPNSPLGLSVDALKNAPFSNYLIPGIFLFAVIGLGNLLSFVLTLLRVKLYPYISGFFGATLVCWIVVQCIILGSVVFLHIMFFSIGALIGLFALFLIHAQNMFPFNCLKSNK